MSYVVNDRLISVSVLETCEVFDRHFRNMEVSRGEDNSRKLALYDLGAYVDPDSLRSRIPRYHTISMDTLLNLLEPKKDGQVSSKLSTRLSANVAFVKDASGRVLPVCVRRVSKNDELRNKQSPFLEICGYIPRHGDNCHWRMEILTTHSQWWSYARLVVGT